MAEQHLIVNGRPVTPVLRPHFISRRQYTNLMKTAELINTAIERVRTLALENPALMARMEMLPAEKMLAQVDPGYAAPVAALLDTQVNNGSLHMTGSQADLPAGVLYNEALSNIFYDALPVKDIRKRFKLSKTGGSKPLVQALLKAWKQFGGSREPVIGVLEFKQAFETPESHESMLLVELFRKSGYRPRSYRPTSWSTANGCCGRADFALDVVYRNLRAHEFLMRFDLRHPLVRAYRERRVCVVNSFRTELTRKRALLALLTDPEVNKSFPGGGTQRDRRDDSVDARRHAGQRRPRPRRRDRSSGVPVEAPRRNWCCGPTTTPTTSCLPGTARPPATRPGTGQCARRCAPHTWRSSACPSIR
jgi:hypothetical protein